MSPGVAIPWPAAPPMPMARSILRTTDLLSERVGTSDGDPRRALRAAGTGLPGNFRRHPKNASHVGEGERRQRQSRDSRGNSAPNTGRGQGAGHAVPQSRRRTKAMAKQGFRIIDAEMHVMEPVDLWERYIDPEFKARAPRRLSERRWDIRTVVEGEVMASMPGGDWPAFTDAEEKTLGERYAEEIARDFDPQSQVRAMDREGLDLA